MIDLSLLHELLRVPAGTDLAPLAAAAKQEHPTLDRLVYSVAAASGQTLPEEVTRGLDHVRARARTFARLADVARAASPNVQEVKGAVIAKRYPAGLVRPVGDLDLVADGEHDLWRAATAIAELGQLSFADLTFFGRPRQTVLTLEWPANDELTEQQLIGVDLSTAAFAGDFDRVPPVQRLPADEWAAALLSVAEERFQRPFQTKDLVDVHVLDQQAPPRHIVEVVAQSRRAPETLELLAAAHAARPLSAAAWLLEELRAPAEAELARRARQPSFKVDDDQDADTRLRLGLCVYGLHLRWAKRPRWDRVRFHRFHNGTLALTPLADYLLVSSGKVAKAAYEAAMAELTRLDPDE
jgi:hypothetical protein